ncbi:MAG: cell surface protein SprA, partial [candidate division KSB1 bacterium]|nr:cell surface protein SprA [candidate division KSB1 bacterium]
MKYDGLEDEIVQNIEAGNIALSLPATRFVSFSGKNSGLFGIKTDMIVGNLNITAIASQEKGENKKLTLTGGAEGATKQIRDYDYLKNTYFFLDEYYRNKYWELDDEGRHKFDPAKVISQLEVYKSAAGYESKQGSIRGWAVLDPANPDTSATGEASQEKYVGYFLRLDKNEYFLEPDLGYIRMDSPVPEGEVLAVAYKDTSSPEPVGDLYFDPLTKSTIVLKIIKPRSPLPGDKTWNLAWRHVYSLGSRNIPPEGFELKIFYDTPSGDDQETITIDGKPKSFLAVFGLDRKDLNGNPNPDNIVDNNPNIIRLSDGELEFLHPRPFDPNPAKLDELGLSPEAKEDTKIELPKNLWTPAIYDTNVQNYITSQSKFYIEVKSKTRSANYSLGFNVIEGSEEVRLNGQTLQRGTDYIIDYFSGNLTILNENATSPSANLEVTYQRNELFQLEKKTLLGMRAEYNLWENSFIGGTMLYLNQRTLDQKVRVGEGPMRNFIWDVNTRLGFKPDFLTRAVDALPFIETKDQSTLNVEAEFAQIIPNPNTLNNENTDDPDGVAYIDDFEAAERPSPLGVMRRGWTPCSPPKEFYDEEKIIDGLPRKTFGLDRMGRLIWYNPYRQVPIKEIWPGRDVNPNVPQGVHVLVLEFTPADSSAGLFPFPPENSWAGLQRYLSAGYADQSESKFLEVWVKGDHGTLHIDLGQISEDVIPNGKLDTEDKLVNQIRNGILDAGEDVGLDGMPGRDPDDFWDIFPLKAPNGLRDWGEPLSYDDWHYTGASEEYSHINGTEGNERDGDAVRVPDTEDINGNGGLDTQNDYFEYSFSLDKNSPDTIYIAGGKGNPYGWRLYRLPLREPHKVVGKPTLSRIEYARLWVDGFSRKGQISLAEINLTGNQWRELGLALSDTAKPDASNDSTVAVTVISTHDNPQYEPPPGVAGIRDRITQVVGKEQSLVLRLTDLPPGANGSVQKTLYQTQSYIDYHKMKMFVHGGDVNLQNFSEDTTQIEYFIRFGADTSNYYEFRERLFFGWDPQNIMDISLVAMA